MNFTNIKTQLEQNGFHVSAFETAAEAADYLDTQIHHKEVGFGGSMSLMEMGLFEKLASHNIVYWHQRPINGLTDEELRQAANASSVYLSSVNGAAETGELINIDNKCNRVAAIYYGHEKVYLVIGKNKIAATCDEALWRARNIAAPMNARRLGMKTPCAVKGDHCYDCKSPDRICRGLSVLWQVPKNGYYEVILVNEDLGY